MLNGVLGQKQPFLSLLSLLPGRAKHFPLPSLGDLLSCTTNSPHFKHHPHFFNLLRAQATLGQAQSLALHKNKPNNNQTSSCSKVARRARPQQGSLAVPGVLTPSTGKPHCHPRHSQSPTVCSTLCSSCTW